MSKSKGLVRQSNVMSTPDDVFSSVDSDSQMAGGEFKVDEADAGSIGRTMFDTPSSKDGTITVLVPAGNIDILPSQALVRVESRKDNRTYLGAVVEGPFAEPDGIRADSTPMVVSTVQGGLLMPKHHGRVQIMLLGERLSGGAVVPPRRRPKPNSPVFVLSSEETAEVLKIRGNLRIGLADGFENLVIRVPADSKGVFPRHVGVLGTTGGGKSTTVSGLVKKARDEGMAVVLIDTEGEYCAINEKTTDAQMLEALERRSLQPTGVEGTRILHLVGRETANPHHPDIKEFALKFSELSPYAVQEILELSDAQQERFFKAYDVTKLAMERFGIWPVSKEDKASVVEIDDLETGFPNMTLAHLHDVVMQISFHISKDESDPNLETPEFRRKQAELKKLIASANLPTNVISWRAVWGKVARLKRLNIFDSRNVAHLDYRGMLQSGKVTILDLSDTDSPQINNLVIAQLLRGIQLQQEENYKDAVNKGEDPVPATVFIEEAHEFLAAHRIKQMPVLFQQVARIARRGRKRWLGLVFITQLPQHLPDEVLGLINNWVLHKIGDANVVNRLRKSIGGIDESLWRHLPSLAPGQAIVSFTTLARPLQASIDPTPCRLLMVE
jgi:hypothetical protein